MVGHHLGQLSLRIGLATVFLVAGLGKVLPKDKYVGQDAAVLANMGVFNPPATPGGNGGGNGGGDTGSENQGAGGGGTRPTALHLSQGRQPEPPATQPGTQPEQPGETRPSRTRPSQPATRVPDATPPAQPETPLPETEERPEQPAPATTAGAAPGQWTAEDFTEPVELPRVYQIALMLHRGAHPGVDENGKAKMALVPAWASDTKVPGIGMATPVVLAWVAAIAEVVGGGMLLVGFMSRLWALGLVGVMGTAIWLTTIGAAMQAGTTFLGFLPDFGPVLQNPQAYNMAFMQLILLCMALAVMFAGPGAISTDGILFGGKDDDEGGEGE